LTVGLEIEATKKKFNAFYIDMNNLPDVYSLRELHVKDRKPIESD